MLEPPVPTGWLELHVGPLPLAQRASIDGDPVRIERRVTPVRVPAGRHRVRMWYLQRLNEAGVVELDVVVAPGQVVPVFYAMPAHILGPGRIGFVPQQRSWAISGAEVLDVLVGFLVLFGLLGLGWLGLTLWRALTG